MKRKFEPFDAETIKKEFFAVPEPDASNLKAAMSLYQRDAGIGYEIKNYGEGLMMLKATNRSQGRNLFFVSETTVDAETGEQTERLIVVLIYKKESQEAPARIIETARRRMKETKK